MDQHRQRQPHNVMAVASKVALSVFPAIDFSKLLRNPGTQATIGQAMQTLAPTLVNVALPLGIAVTGTLALIRFLKARQTSQSCKGDAVETLLSIEELFDKILDEHAAQHIGRNWRAAESNRNVVVTLMGADCMQKIKVDIEIVQISETIMDMIKDADEGETIYIPRVSTKILAMVIEYCHEHTKRWFQMGFIQAEEGLKTWDAEFITVDQATFFQLFLAAKYLKIQPLMQLTDEAVGNIIKGKTPEDVRVFFNIVSFFSQC